MSLSESQIAIHEEKKEKKKKISEGFSIELRKKKKERKNIRTARKYSDLFFAISSGHKTDSCKQDSPNFTTSFFLQMCIKYNHLLSLHFSND